MPEQLVSLSRIGQPFRVIRAAARVALTDMRAIYTPTTWTLGWLGRITMQVIFFALIGRLLGTREALLYLFIGQAVMAAVVECFLAIPSSTWEHRTGTLPLITAAPGPLWPVFLGRSLQWVPSGVATSSIVLLIVGPFFGLRWSAAAVPVVIIALAVVAFSMYAIALTLAAVVLKATRWRNVAANLSQLTVMLLCGVTVPIAIWPAWLQAVAQVLPLTHGLAAIRTLAEHGVTPQVWPQLLAALLLGLVWYAIAALAFTIFGEMSRKDGSLDLSDG